METGTFLEASRKAQEIVAGIEDPAYRAVAYGVAMQTLISESDSRSADELRPKHVSKNDGAEKQIKSDTKRRILELKADGYFKDPKLPSEVRSELRTLGFHHNPADVRMALLRLAQEKSLRRLTDGGNNFRYAQM